MKTVLEALTEAEKTLSAQGVPDARLDAEILLAEAFQMPRLSLRIDKQRAVPERVQEKLDAWTARRAAREPLQYILGVQYFMGFPFKVDRRVLIPRFDTETLCEAALSRTFSGACVLDLCTGSGALAVAIAKLKPSAIVAASDISADALSLARENASALGANVRFVQGDLFEPLGTECFDLIVSNPPYIPDGQRIGLQAEVQREPALALFAGADGLDMYRRIAAEAPQHLRENGWLLLEIGDGEADAVRALLEPAFQVEPVLYDLNQLPRVLAAQKR